MNVNFLTAADAFLYLPVYLADKCEIYKGIDEKINVDVFSPLDCNNNCGDAVALNQLLENNKSGSDISIAVCDPFAMFDNSIKSDLSEFRVLGSMISKVPFWAVNGPNNQDSPDESSLSGFDRVICYDQKLTTGNYIGMRTYEKNKIPHYDTVPFGNEFDILLNDKDKKSFAVTCDVISLALLDGKVSVKHSYSKNKDYRNFITTALITTKSAYEEHHADLAKILQGVQSALGIVLTSKSIAISVCRQLIDKNGKEKKKNEVDRNFFSDYHKTLITSEELNEDQIKIIVDYIYRGGFYNENLQISKLQWNSTLDNYANNYKTSEKRKLCLDAKELYEEIVVNKTLIEAQKRHLKAVCISLTQLSQDLIDESLITQKQELIQEFEEEKNLINESLTNQKDGLIQEFEKEKNILLTEQAELLYKLEKEKKQVRLESILVTISIVGGILFILSSIPYLNINGTGKLIGIIAGASLPVYYMLNLLGKKTPSKTSIIIITCIIAGVFVSATFTFKYLALYEPDQHQKELYDGIQNICLGLAFGIPGLISLLLLIKKDEK